MMSTISEFLERITFFNSYVEINKNKKNDDR
jgi:hypothetical protein